jgi:hypothetical protein
MQLHEVTSAMIGRVTGHFKGLQRFARLEIVLASVCFFIPVLLMAFDGWSPRPSISRYYDMKEAVVFYFPLTVAVMLFVVNGLVKHQSWYNGVLGVLLALVVLFNCEDAAIPHYVGAVGFFGGNALVILVYSSKKERWFKGLLVAVVALAMLGCFAFGWFSLFWAEWISFAIIALHYAIEARASLRQVARTEEVVTRVLV